jgi:hypothetical protein
VQTFMPLALAGGFCLMDELKLELQNRAISRAAVGMSTTAQVAAVASALCWPVGLWVGGWLGVAALASAAVLVMGGTVAAIDEEIKAIEGGDKDKIKGWLTGDDLAEAMERHGLGGNAGVPKAPGHQRSGSDGEPVILRPDSDGTYRRV